MSSLEEPPSSLSFREEEIGWSSMVALNGSTRHNTLQSSGCDVKFRRQPFESGMVRTFRMSGGWRKVNIWAITSQPIARMGGLPSLKLLPLIRLLLLIGEERDFVMLPCKADCFDFFLRVINFNLRSCSASASRLALKYANSSPSDSEKLDEESEVDDEDDDEYDDEYDDFNESSRLRLFPSSSSSMVSELPEEPKSAISDDTS